MHLCDHEKHAAEDPVSECCSLFTQTDLTGWIQAPISDKCEYIIKKMKSTQDKCILCASTKTLFLSQFQWPAKKKTVQIRYVLKVKEKWFWITIQSLMILEEEKQSKNDDCNKELLGLGLLLQNKKMSTDAPMMQRSSTTWNRKLSRNCTVEIKLFLKNASFLNLIKTFLQKFVYVMTFLSQTCTSFVMVQVVLPWILLSLVLEWKRAWTHQNFQTKAQIHLRS